MKQIWGWVKNNPNRTMFLIPILLVAGISISHVITWYELSNPINWAVYLSISIEIGAMTALIATTNKIRGGVWFMFIVVTFIQMVGNIFYSYKEIDENGDLFKSWVELTGPIWELMGTETTDVVGMKRWLSFLTGGLLPIISLTSLHFFVKYEKPEEKKSVSVKNTQTESNRVWENVKELKKEGKLTEPTEEEIKNEPTVLANSQYRDKIEEHNSDDEQPSLVEEENPEDEILYQQPNVKEKTIKDINLNSNKTIKETNIKNVGQELSKTWENIIKKRRNNNITRLGG